MKLELKFGLGIRMLITTPDSITLDEAIHRFTGGNTLLTSNYETGLDQKISQDQTPDMRSGAVLHIWTPINANQIIDKSDNFNNEDIERILIAQKFNLSNITESKNILIKAVENRIRDALLPIPQIAIFSWANQRDSQLKIDLNLFSSKLSKTANLQILSAENYFDVKNKDGYSGYCFRMMGGPVYIEDQFVELGLSGAAFIIITANLQIGLEAGRQALKIIESFPGISHIFDVCGSGLLPKNFKPSKPELDEHEIISESNNNGKIGLEIIMNSFDYSGLVRCIKKIVKKLEEYNNEINIVPAYYNRQWGDVFIELN